MKLASLQREIGLIEDRKAIERLQQQWGHYVSEGMATEAAALFSDGPVASIEYAQQGIRVNSVCPGYIQTDMTKDIMQRVPERVTVTTPMRRMGQPQEIAEMVTWLCSDRASFVTGANYNVDGGYVAM